VKKLKFIKVAITAILCAVIFTGCMPTDAVRLTEDDIDLIQLNPPVDGQETAVITTSVGTITMILYEDEAPNTVKHFKKLIAQGFYDNKDVFSEEGSTSFVTGATDELGSEGKLVTDDGKPIECEITPNLWHFSGAVSVLGWDKNMLSKKYLSDSRFFIIGNKKPTEELTKEYPKKVIDAYKKLGGYPQYTSSYTVFGQVVDGMNVVDKISNQELDPETKEPLTKITIQRVELSKYKKAE